MDNLNSISGVPSVLLLDHGKNKTQYNNNRNAEALEKWVLQQLTKHNTRQNRSKRNGVMKGTHRQITKKQRPLVKRGRPRKRLNRGSRNNTIDIGRLVHDSISRNFNRLDNEIKQYKYKPIINTFYYVDESHFRIDKVMNKRIANFENCENKISLTSLFLRYS